MKILHRISLKMSNDAHHELAKLGIEIALEAPNQFVTFTVQESQVPWPELQNWIARHRAVDIPSTKFTRSEIKNANWLELCPDWHHGYPQPNEEAFCYLDATYDLENFCPECGIGKKQKAPFQMKAEPKWGNRSILQLYWIFDEFFVKPETWTTIFKPHGIQARPVIDQHKKELETVVQLVVEEEVQLSVTDLPFQQCHTCGQPKYYPHNKGFFPSLKNEPVGAIARTAEMFGSGASAHQGIILAQSVAQDISTHKIKGASLKPVTETKTEPFHKEK